MRPGSQTHQKFMPTHRRLGHAGTPAPSHAEIGRSWKARRPIQLTQSFKHAFRVISNHHDTVVFWPPSRHHFQSRTFLVFQLEIFSKRGMAWALSTNDKNETYFLVVRHQWVPPFWWWFQSHLDVFSQNGNLAQIKVKMDFFLILSSCSIPVCTSPPFFVGWFLNHHYFNMGLVRVYHHPKRTTISKVVVHFQGHGKQQQKSWIRSQQKQNPGHLLRKSRLRLQSFLGESVEAFKV